MPQNRDLDFEESVFDSYAQDLDHVEFPLSRKAFVFVVSLTGFLIAIVFFRVAGPHLFNGVFYKSRAEANVHREVIIPAYRGIIVDRYGEPLVENQPSFSVFVNLAEILRNTEDFDGALAKLAEVLEVSADDILFKINEASVNQNIIAVGRNITPDQIIALESLKIKGVTIEDDYVRSYKNGPAFSHVLGYHGEVAIGLESIYDDHLRGQDGVSVIFENVKGESIDKKILSEAVSGEELQLTIDAGLQEFFYNRLNSAIHSLGSKGGVGLVLNPQNGEVLSLVSLPSYDNNLFARSGNSQQKVKLLNNPSQPLFNRAVSGVYNPGSTIKPLVALAALREGLITPEGEVFSRGYIEIPNPYFPDQPSRFVDWKPHGWVDVHSALARSSNVYFYTLGGGLPSTEASLLRGTISIKGLGIKKLRAYWQKFLLDQKTGIDLSSENSGFLPDPEEKEKRTGQIWRIGDTYNVSIGQGDLLVTPLELLNFIGSIANGGKIYQPHLVGGQSPATLLDYSEWSNEIKEVQFGMEDAVSRWYGTANLLSSLPITAAAKTGTAQTQNNTKTNAFFVGYLPAEDPQVAILVLVENAREGGLNAVPVAKDVLEWYYYNRVIANNANVQHLPAGRQE